MRYKKKKKKNNALLLVIVSFLFLVIIGEIYYVFFSPKQDVSEVSTNQTNNKQGEETKKEISDGQTKRVFDSILAHQNEIRPLYQAGILTNYVVTEAYQSVIVEFGKRDVVKKVGGKDVHFTYILSFKNNTNTEGNKTTLLFSEQEIARISAVRLDGSKEEPIQLSDIHPGDQATISVQSNYLVNPIDSLISMKITKLQ